MRRRDARRRGPRTNFLEPPRRSQCSRGSGADASAFEEGFHWWTETAAEAKRFATIAEAEAFPAYQMIASDPTISLTEHVFLGSIR